MTNRYDIDPNGPPCIRYDPKKVNPARLAPPPPDPVIPDKPSKGIGKNNSPLTEERRLIAAIRDACPHKWRRVGPVKKEFGVERVRSRCATCKKEKVMDASQVAARYKKKQK